MNFLYNILAYFFGPMPGPKFNYYIPLLILILLLAIFAVILKFYLKKHRNDKALRKTLRQFPSKIIYLALLLLLALASRYANIYLLSMRLLFFGALGWGIYIFYQLYMAYQFKYPAMKKKLTEQHLANRYTPNKKKHKKKK